MFFRIVTARYKDKEYHYLKLLESYRYGDTIKQRVLMNISTLNHINRDQADGLTRELQQILALGKTFKEKKLLSPGLVDLAFLLATEYSLKPKMIYGNKLKRMLTEKEKRNAHLISSEAIINNIKNIIPEQGAEGEAILWIQAFDEIIPNNTKGLAILFNCQGYIIGHFPVKNFGQVHWQEEVQRYVKDSLGLSLLCILISEKAFQDELCGPSLENCSELYITLGSGRSAAKEIKKFHMAALSQNYHLDIISSLLPEIYNSQHWFARRLRTTSKKSSANGLTIRELWIIAHTFHKLIDLSAKRYDLIT